MPDNPLYHAAVKQSLADLLDQAEALVTARLSALALKGGEGSGNFGHEGRPGEVGGSGPGGGDSEGETGGSSITGNYTDLKKMPSEIDGVPITISKLTDKRSLAVANSSGIVINKGAKQWKDIAGYQKEAYAAGWVSTDDPNGVVLHELGHYKHRQEAGSMFENYKNTNSSSSPRFKTLASRVSKYAATNGVEFVSEVYAGLKTGRTYDESVMGMYHEMRGPKP